jgi:hypothetical protein
MIGSIHAHDCGADHGRRALTVEGSGEPNVLIAGKRFHRDVQAAIGLDETSAAHDVTAGRWLLLVVVLAAMAATYAAQFVVAARWARRSPATAAIAAG